MVCANLRFIAKKKLGVEKVQYVSCEHPLVPKGKAMYKSSMHHQLLK